MKKTLVLYPTPAIGHLKAMVELGKLILKHRPSLSITILISEAPYDSDSTNSYLSRVSNTTPEIHFHHLPSVPFPLETYNSPHHETLTFELLRLNNPLVHQALQIISESSTIKGLIIDFFCAIVLEVANELNIPTFYFVTSCSAFLAVCMYLTTLHKNSTKSFKDICDHLQIPGIPPILATDMPKPTLDRNDKAYEGFLYFSSSLHESKGFIINSFESLEPRALKAMRDGVLRPDTPTPPIYSIGPLIADRGGSSSDHECLSWLDSQPTQRVVFLCFGSLGLFSEAQIREIAKGLEKSGQRFLWVVRNPPSEEKSSKQAEPDLNTLLPEGFLDRTKGKGLVVKTWAPQVEVLSHESIGGFVTHCGWNSVLEAVCAGVPMVAWPLYAEQRMNRVFLVEEMKIAFPMEESKEGFVNAGEVEKRVKQLMESEEGEKIRERAVRFCEDAKVAMSEDESSIKALSEVAELWS